MTRENDGSSVVQIVEVIGRWAARGAVVKILNSKR